ncbi:39kDa subunit of ndufa9, NADH:ubiquinone oxidoreductase [Boothiomyces sp. JEL0838]|nr:39kDa subunit of ndufa9, NADH:ubiquinone oxidoreductase [Boothiomyces sp. JEL0838]
MAEERPVDYLVVGLGTPQPEFIVTRQNDYLANCISMQTTLLKNAVSGQTIVAENVIPEDFKRPVFTRTVDLYADINDSVFSLTEADLHQGPASSLKPGADTIVKKTFRMVICKPLTSIEESGLVVKKAIAHYNIKDISKQLIVVFDDMNTLPGTIAIQHGSDIRGADHHHGVKSILKELGTNSFVRFRMGVGSPSAGKESPESYAIQNFPEANREIDLFGHALDVSGQALQHYAAFGDIKDTTKKFKSKKLPKTLRKLPGLLFPVDVRQLHDVVVREKKVILRQGPGGRSSNNGITATVFGATGFVGRNLVNNLGTLELIAGKRGTTIVTPYRGVDDDRRFLRPMADLGKMVQLRYDLRDEVSIAECVRHSDVVYNCIGRNFPTKNFSFDKVHHEGARRLAKIAREEGVSKFIHVSALNADVDSPSAFLRSKALGEIAVREEFPEATIVRPAWIFGHEDRFWNRLGWFSKWVPFSVMIAPNGGHAVMRPVFVGDVAAVLAQMAKEDATVGKDVELYGPNTYHYHKLIELFQDAAMRQNHTVSIPKILLNPSALTFENFGIVPHTPEETIHRFVGMYRDDVFSGAPVNQLTKNYTIQESDA